MYVYNDGQGPDVHVYTVFAHVLFIAGRQRYTLYVHVHVLYMCNTCMSCYMQKYIVCIDIHINIGSIHNIIGVGSCWCR